MLRIRRRGKDESLGNDERPTGLPQGRFWLGAGRVLAGAMLAMLAQDALAEPAAYWRWRSTSNGQEFCSQTSPGPGWTQVAGPFRDLQCREPGSVPLRRWAEPPQRRF
ncbi:hypothetical protein [Pseudomonas oryzihabitans]|uniref:hypothetical protein n=2 Tax=Pseudomonas oryzihabitans TaxID=47885 RepID=UPI002864C418|nr:hypothetical protein [Pseudomonas psychrotolerans]MDR6680677.1 hypothetical protein [Pseudomonas psychrotolerans]